jgi:hypothetical protein
MSNRFNAPQTIRQLISTAVLLSGVIFARAPAKWIFESASLLQPKEIDGELFCDPNLVLRKLNAQRPFTFPVTPV